MAFVVGVLLLALIMCLAVVFKPDKASAAFTVNWSELTPAGTEPLSQGDDRVREFKKAIRERLAIDHAFDSSDLTTTDTIGFHKWVTLLEQSTDPDTKANAGRLYTKDTDSVATLYFRPHGAGTALRLTWGKDSTNPDSTVNLTGDQTVAGSKTFSAETTFSDTCNFNDDTVFDSTYIHGLDVYTAPTLSRQFAPMGYVDAQVTASGADRIQVDTAIGTSDISVDTTVYQDMADMTYTDTFVAGNVFILFDAPFEVNGGGGGMTCKIDVDGVSARTMIVDFYAGYHQPFSMSCSTYVSAGSHTIKIQWLRKAGYPVEQSGATLGKRVLTIIRGLN